MEESASTFSGTSMEGPRVSRRQALLALGSGLVASTAGCAAVEPPGSAADSEADDESSNPPDSERFVDLYDDVADAVVELRAVADPTDPFGDAEGSGFMGPGSTIVTNAHVVMDRDQVQIRYRDDTWGEGTVIGRDIHSDLAIIDPVDPPDVVESISFADGMPTIGEEVMAIGSPLGFGGSASTGIVSGVNRSLPSPTAFSIPAAIQTDAAVNPGNSGGPLVGLDGGVYGVVFAGASENVGFAISAPLATQVLPVLRQGASYDHSYLGVQLAEVTPRIATANDAPTSNGVYVHAVEAGAPADGLLQGSTGDATVDNQTVPVGGDVIIAIGGTEIPHLDALSAHLALETDPGDHITVTVIRDGEQRDVIVIVGNRDNAPS